MVDKIWIRLCHDRNYVAAVTDRFVTRSPLNSVNDSEHCPTQRSILLWEQFQQAESSDPPEGCWCPYLIKNTKWIKNHFVQSNLSNLQNCKLDKPRKLTFGKLTFVVSKLTEIRAKVKVNVLGLNFLGSLVPNNVSPVAQGSQMQKVKFFITVLEFFPEGLVMYLINMLSILNFFSSHCFFGHFLKFYRAIQIIIGIIQLNNPIIIGLIAGLLIRKIAGNT